MENQLHTIAWPSITEKSEESCIDFSVNTNSLGIPDTVLSNFSKIAELAGSYPDPECNLLSAHLADKYNVSQNHILCGNGADDLLYRIVFSLRPKQALIIEPAFEEYNLALDLVGCEVHHHQLKASDQFALDETVLSAIQENYDMVFLCNPNNPTGQLVKPALLKKMIERCEKNEILLIVDECFMEFIPDWESCSVKQATASFQYLLVIDAFTKTYSLAGFRLGFCISGNISLLSQMKVQGQSFGVSVPAQFAGICALMDPAYLSKTYLHIAKERTWLLSKLNAPGIQVWPSQCNFLLLRTQHSNIVAELLLKDIKVRDCSRFYGLGPEYCRIAIKSHAENEHFVNMISTVFQ